MHNLQTNQAKKEGDMEILAGKITHYYNRIGVAVVVLTSEIKTGDTIHILGHTSDFTQIVSSLEIDHKKVLSIQAGLEAALKVAEPVRSGDELYKVMDE